jgi:RimJ/RimL family protein N-acetyltransferase
LSTTAITLQLLDESHLAMVEGMLDDPDVLRFTLIPVPVPRDFTRSWYASYEKARRDGTREAFAICDADGTPVGVALAPMINRGTRTMELGYMVAPQARGRGVATAGLRLLTRWAFERGAERVELRISVQNQASRRVAERSGYTCDGVMRSAYVKQGVREDTEIWSRLPSDPEPD